MGQLTINLTEEQLDALRRYAARRQRPVSHLIQDYVDYLLAGGTPLPDAQDDTLESHELGYLAQHGGAFDWLEDEPEIYSVEDGERV